MKPIKAWALACNGGVLLSTISRVKPSLADWGPFAKMVRVEIREVPKKVKR